MLLEGRRVTEWEASTVLERVNRGPAAGAGDVLFLQAGTESVGKKSSKSGTFFFHRYFSFKNTIPME